ncbi:hypothetical protein F4808DRAFT_452187 [Astrocystis sublimbata]|nr:hypothetical protein F4808DRAFT_452187 [Astrocystis sublimbata]
MRLKLKTSDHIGVTKGLTWRWRHTHHIKLPGWTYDMPESKQQEFRHRDFVGRVCIVPLEDRYPHHENGELRKLIVSCTDELLEGEDSTTWRRTYLRNVAPMKVRIATWVVECRRDPRSWEDWLILRLRYIPASIAMSLCDVSSNYAPILYQFHGTAKVWSNYLENGTAIAPRSLSNVAYRVLKPRHLCFLRSPQSKEMMGVDVRSAKDWETTDGAGAALSYLFIAYSTEQFKHSSVADSKALHHIAESAARAAGTSSYWVYRISDANEAEHLTTGQLLAQWGSRMWTFPEVLLSPGNDIAVYTRGGDMRRPLRISKNQFAGHVWADDAMDARQLLDHYLGNLELSRLELATIALKCLYKRQRGRHLDGDHAYALMGLLRLRPQIDSTDSQFQAFARVSLANDSDRLLERYICTMPATTDQPWHDMEDVYHSSLWDIEPYCQVAALCEDDTVIIDGARGASIRWKSFLPVAYRTGASESLLFMLLLAALEAGFGPSSVGILLLLLSSCIWLYSPVLIRTQYGGKLRQVQAALFGFEGYVNAATIEHAIFGGNFGRIGWSTNSSPLSRFEVNEFGEKEGIDPTKDPKVCMKVDQAKKAGPKDMRVFTLVDTYNMQITLFEAVRPPTVLLCCASEGGMQRAIGCSYDWTTQSMYREVVLRLPTDTLDAMDRVPRIRIGVKRPEIHVKRTVTSTV